MHLEFAALGPYPGVETVDFSDMNGITLVCGNTGAGKTFIFDAVTFALYGESSGGDRDPATMRSSFADPKVESYVKLVFEHDRKEYTICRWPAQPRPKRGGGTRDQAEKREMYLPDGRTLVKKTEITDEVKRITGLTAEQWGQVVMLAQGKFRAFIDAKSEKRGEILESIFNIGIYSRIEDMLGELSRDAVRQLEAAGDTLSGFAKGLILDEDLPESKEFRNIFEESKTAVNKGTRICELMDAICVHDAEAVVAAEGVYKDAEARASTADKMYKEAENLHKAFEACKTEEEALKTLEAEKPAFDGRREKNEAAKAILMKVKPAEGSLKTAKEEYDRAVAAKQTAIDNLDACRQAVTAAAEKLTAAESRTEEMEDKKKESTALSEQIPKYGEADAKKTEYDNESQILQEMQDKVTEEAQKHTELEAKVAANRAVLTRTEHSGAELVEQTALQADLDKKILAAGSLITALNTYSSAKIKRDDAEAKSTEAFRKWDEANRELFSKRAEFIRGQAGIIAESLEEGAPCPVCGSTSHPHPAVRVDGCPTQDDIDALSAEWDRLKESAGKVKDALGDANIELQKARGSVDSNIEKSGIVVDPDSDDAPAVIKQAKEALAAEKKTVSDRIRVLKAECEERERINKEFGDSDPTEESQKALDALRMETSTQGSKVAGLKAEYDSISKGLKFASKDDLQKHIDALAADIDIIGKAIDGARVEKADADKKFSGAEATLASADKAVTDASVKVEACGRAFNDAVAAQGFSSVEEYRANVRTEEQVKAEDQEIDAFTEKLQKQTGKLAQAREAVKDKVDPENLEELRIASEAAASERDSKSADRGAAISRRDDNVKKTDDIRKTLDDISNTMSQMLEMKELADVASGKRKDENGQRMSFSDYVRSKYFDSILSRAEKRLLYMTNDRYILRRPKSVSSGSNSHMLELEIIDNDSPEAPPRPVSSLSGGESFKAALALALGFSDAIQDNAAGQRIDALFIDEGFGTLDDEALEQAIDILEDLSGGSKSVCIISHVAKLRERIPRQIVVDYDKKHGSTMSVIKD